MNRMTKESREQDDDMNCGLTAAERRELRSRLAGLPDTTPPRAVWQRIESQARAEGLIRRPGVSVAARWIAGSGIAAAVVLAVLKLPTAGLPGDAGVGRNVADDSALPTTPAYDESLDAPQLNSINALMVRSQLLERDLRRLPLQPQVMRAGTSATIDDLQYRIAAIDEQLNDAELRMTAEQREAYWRERVRLMDSLLRLRYAQAQRVSF